MEGLLSTGPTPSSLNLTWCDTSHLYHINQYFFTTFLKVLLQAIIYREKIQHTCSNLWALLVLPLLPWIFGPKLYILGNKFLRCGIITSMCLLRPQFTGGRIKDNRRGRLLTTNAGKRVFLRISDHRFQSWFKSPHISKSWHFE